MKAERTMILTECLKRETEVAAMPKPPKWKSWDVREWLELNEYGPRYSIPQWFGDRSGFVPERHRSRILRETWAMHEDGLLICTRVGARLAHVKLTPEGRQLVEQLTVPTQNSVGDLNQV